MTVNKHFAQDGGDLDASMDQLVEALAQLLDEPAHPQIQPVAPAVSDLHLGDNRAIHVIDNEPKK